MVKEPTWLENFVFQFGNYVGNEIRIGISKKRHWRHEGSVEY